MSVMVALAVQDLPMPRDGETAKLILCSLRLHEDELANARRRAARLTVDLRNAEAEHKAQGRPARTWAEVMQLSIHEDVAYKHVEWVGARVARLQAMLATRAA